MRRFAAIATICILSLSPFVFAQKGGEDEKVRLVRTESYSITRFQEVVEAALSSEPTSLKDRLIRLRAQLEIAKRKRSELEKPDAEANHDLYLRAADAQVDHYRQLIQRIERKVLKKR